MRVEELKDLFREINGELSRKATLFSIGGLPMILREQKPATLDADLIAPTNVDYKATTEALEGLGFNPPALGIQFEDFRGRKIEVDIKGFRGIPLSSQMMKRGEPAPIGGLDKLELVLASDDDNIIFKSMGEREKDIDDIHSIVSESTNWNTILEEAEKLTIITQTRKETPILIPGFVAVSLRRVKEKHGGISEDVIEKFERSALKLNERMSEKDQG